MQCNSSGGQLQIHDMLHPAVPRGTCLLCEVGIEKSHIIIRGYRAQEKRREMCWVSGPLKSIRALSCETHPVARYTSGNIGYSIIAGMMVLSG